MFKRKLIALAIVVIMAVGMLPVTALASGTGQAIMVETERISVELPTGEAFNFWLDPQGLLGLAPGQAATPGALAASAGKIIFKSDFAPTIVNKSSVAVDVGITMGVTGSATSITTDPAAATGTATSLRIQVFHANRNAFMSNTETSFSFVATSTGITGINISDAPVAPASYSSHQLLYLTEASYLIRNDHATGTEATPISIQDHIDNDTFDPSLYSFAPDVATPTFMGAQFMLEGGVNKTGEWEPFTDGTSSVGLEFRYAFRKTIATTAPTLTSGSFAHVAAAGSGDLFASSIPDVGWHSPTINLPFGGSASVTVGFNYGGFDLTLATLFTGPNGTGDGYMLVAADGAFDQAAGTFTLHRGSASRVSALLPVGTYSVVVNLSNGQSYTANIVCS